MQLPMAIQTAEQLNSPDGSDRPLAAKREFSVSIKKPCHAMLKSPSSPAAGHANRALWHSVGALLTEQLAGAARYGKQPL